MHISLTKPVSSSWEGVMVFIFVSSPTISDQQQELNEFGQMNKQTYEVYSFKKKHMASTCAQSKKPYVVPLPNMIK